MPPWEARYRVDPKGPPTCLDWRRLVAFLGAHMDLPRLSLTVHTEVPVYSVVEDLLMADDITTRWAWRATWRLLYDIAIDIATQLCTLKTLGGVHIIFGVFDDLEQWLEREILGRRFHGVVRAEEEAKGRISRRRVRQESRMPKYHDMNKRLVGSNYHPEDKLTGV